MTRLRVIPALLLAACSLDSGNPSDGSAPQVVIDSPLNGAVVANQVPIQVSAVDDFGVDKVEIVIDNNPAIVLFDPPYVTVWNTASVPDNSTHTILARAYDVAQNVGTRQITVTVDKGVQ
ncbi:MAG TPA: Ig-like domain-containing protein [Gemmatimonadales bacterium]|nr:Ig-like domain-containing protein [Gemmatimonadales bacterium]